MEIFDLVIGVEFGHISSDKDEAEKVFSNLSLRSGRKLTIITTSLSLERWKEIFGDPVLTAEMADRPAPKAYIINMKAMSNRVMESKAMINS